MDTNEGRRRFVAGDGRLFEKQKFDEEKKIRRGPSLSEPEREAERAAFIAFVGLFHVGWTTAFAKAVLYVLPGLSAYVRYAHAHCRVPGAVGFSRFSL